MPIISHSNQFSKFRQHAGDLYFHCQQLLQSSPVANRPHLVVTWWKGPPASPETYLKCAWERQIFQDRTWQIEEGLRKLMTCLSMPTLNWLCWFVLMVQNPVHIHIHICMYRTTRRRVCIYIYICSGSFRRSVYVGVATTHSACEVIFADICCTDWCSVAPGSRYDLGYRCITNNFLLRSFGDIFP